MDSKLRKFTTNRQATTFPCRDWIASFLIVVLFFCPVFPGSNLSPLPFSHMAQASGEGDYYDDYYDAGEMADPYSMDSDGDGLSDGLEQEGFEIYVSYWDDSLGDYYYYTDYIITDPYDEDSDDDGWPDGYEYLYGYHPMDPSDGNADRDGDGLSNGTEYGLGTNANKTDSDDDGWDDGDEVLLLLTDPNDASDPPAPDPYEVDSDGDGYSDGAEADAGTNASDAGSFPAIQEPDMGVGETETGIEEEENGSTEPEPENPVDPNDIDGDGLLDAWEVINGYDPNNADDSTFDLDDDGLDGLSEFVLGTDASLWDTDGDGLGDGEEVLGMARPDPYWGPMGYEEMIDIYDEFGNYLYTETVYYEAEDPLYFSDPTLADSDGDGYSDKFEMGNGLNPLDPSDINNLNYEGLPEAFAQWHEYQGNPISGYDDSDGDGLVNADEFSAGADPFLQDTDADGIDDGEEYMGFEIVLVTTQTMIYPTEVYDEESGEVIYEEYTETYAESTNEWVYTDPANPDTDGDGWTDGWERDNGYNPIDPSDGNKDSDGDGVSDGKEHLLGTDANDASDGEMDSDGDGVGNATELALGTDPTKRSDGIVDSDGDGVSNAQEVADGTNPGNAAVFVSSSGSNQGSEATSGTEGSSSGTAGDNDGDEGFAPSSGATIRVMVRTIFTHSDPTIDGNESGEVVSTWIEDNGWFTTLSGADEALAEGDKSTAFPTIRDAHYGAQFPQSTPDDEKGWTEYDDRQEIKASASASKFESGSVDFFTVSAQKIEVKLLAAEEVDGAVSRQFLKGSKVGEADESFEAIRLTIEKDKRESETYELDPIIMLDTKSVIRLLPVGIVPDYNRDGKIDDEDRGKVTENNPFRWWVNDDDDKVNTPRGKNDHDIPGQGQDLSDDKVDGIRDLIDFFPLHLDIQDILEILPEYEYVYLLKHEDEAVNFFEAPDVVLADNESGEGPNRHIIDASAAEGVQNQQLKGTGPGNLLSQEMLLNLKEGKGVIYVEATKKTTKPLILEIQKIDTTPIAEIKFPVNFAGVDDMYRHVNLRGFTGGSGGHPTQQEEAPEYPDDLTNGKYVAYFHGYNVSGESAEGSQSNIFKRLHQLGSKARFIGVSWHGNPDNPGFNSGFLPDYHRATYNGLVTSTYLSNYLGFTQKADLTVMAHSLGNSVVSNAIANQGFQVDRYYIINGAIPLQAYDSAQTSNSSGDADMARNMTEDDWKPYYDYGEGSEQRLFAANWHELFDSPDSRSKLTWKNIFAKPQLLSVAYNFYSPSDEVVENADESEEFGDIGNLLSGISQGRHAWVQQEIGKGGQFALFPALFNDINGGWKFHYIVDQPVPHPWYRGYYKESLFKGSKLYRKYTPGEAASEISADDLRLKPFYKPFLYMDLYDPVGGSAVAGSLDKRYRLLGTGIPATSYAVAANSLTKLDQVNGGEQRNFNMPSALKNSNSTWPEHVNANALGDWLHSDFKDVALPYLYPMYEEMIELGELDKD